MRRKCIKCNKVIKIDSETGVLIKGVELLSYAHHKSEHNYGQNFNAKVVLFCICDECYKIELKKGPKSITSKKRPRISYLLS